MRRFMFVTAFLFFFMTGQVFAADNLTNAASKIESGILSVLNGIGSTISHAAKETGKTGLHRETEIRKLLQKNYIAGKPYAINSTFIDSKGMMKFIEPEQYRSYEGSDISGQKAIIKMLKTKKPRMGNVFVSVEGIKCIDIEYPVFSKGKQFLGSVSMIVKHIEMIRTVVEPIEKDLGVKSWVMQKDGLILYETDPTQTGLNLFTDPLYKDYPELIALGKRTIKEKEGVGFYTFLIHGTKNVVKKRAAWKTVHFLSNDWIIVTYSEVK
ncbi:MAG: methyl-accepting chemotaxis protein [Syntrophaceae bacterium]|nr:MAG: methyl-accepting chemotaxis protein [Syntrophaceae bacterium]